MCSNMCAMCGGTTSQMNYAKQVDPPRRPYGTILGDRVEEPSYKSGGQKPCMQMCLPTVSGNQNMARGCHHPTSIIQTPCDPVKPCPKIICEPCPPRPPTKIWLIKSSPAPQKALFLLQKPEKTNKQLQSACLPVGDSSKHNCCAKHLVVYLPCPSPEEFNKCQQTNREPCVQYIPFCVPQKIQGGTEPKKAGKYLPPPEKKICLPHCIHKSDIKNERPCTWKKGIPCVAHCFDTFQNPC